MKQLNFTIKSGLTDNAPRELIISEEFLKFENKNILDDTFTTFKKNEIAEYRFGVKWVKFYLVIAREFVIEIKNFDGEIIKINFKTYFGRKKEKYHELCNQILSGLWENYFDEIASNYIKKHESGEEFSIGDVTFLSEGVIIKTNSSIRQKQVLIPWDKIRTKTYVTYFAIYAVDNASITNRGYNYLTDWNTTILRSVVITLLKRKNIDQ